ncbi:MAG: hypothetical protein H8D95_00925 [Candidatus Endolissoclinum sp.]|nr:hypothetical protein [Candidatus Endolissoclinum sp.]
MREIYAIQYSSYLTEGGEFLSALIVNHSGFNESVENDIPQDKELLTIETLTDWDHTKEYIIEPHTIIIPFVHMHFRERMIKVWEQLDSARGRLTVYEFDKQYRMINDYLYDTGHKHGNIYKDFRDERINNNNSPIKLEFIDVGRLLMYKDSEYDKLVTALNTTPLSKDDVFCCNSWKDYIEQYISNQMIIKK